MYATSFGLVILAAVMLAVGLFQNGLSFIYASIGSSVLAAVFLAIGVLQKKPVQPATAGAPYAPAGATDDTALTAPSVPVVPPPAAAPTETIVGGDETEEAEEPEEEVAPPPPPPPAAARRPAARTPAPATKRTPTRPAAAKPAASKAAPSKAVPRGAQVVAIPERGTYHVPGCRFVKGRRDTERMAKSAATRRGYSPCGVCKP